MMPWILIVFALVAPLNAAAADLRVPSAPAEVVVYPQGARVQRLGSVSLAAGEQTLLLEGLPAQLREDSLRLSVVGPAGTKVFGVRLRQAFGEKEALERRRVLEQQLEELKDQRDEQSDRIGARHAEMDVLKAVAGKDAAKADAKGLTGLVDGASAVGRRLAALMAANRKEQREQRALDRRIAALQADLDGQGPGSRMTRVAEADLQVPVAGTVSVELSYFIDAAGWSPRYDLRLKAADKEPKAELEFLAELRQSSGEDWKGVKLSLSTARPTLDSQVPDPTQWWLDYAPEARHRLEMLSGLAMRSKTAAAPAPAMAEAADSAVVEEARYEQAQTQDLGPATLFVVARKQDIPADGNGHRVAISSGSHSAELGLVVVPRLSDAGFIEAKIRYQGEQPLLAGPVQLFRDADLAGQAWLAFTAPGESLTLGFGQDERIKAERKRLKQKGGSAGIFGSKGKVRYDWALKVSNFHQGLRSVEVREQLPRSRQDAIKVSALTLDPKPLPESEDKPGLQVWKLELKPGESRELKLSYEVQWPEAKRVQGLE